MKSKIVAILMCLSFSFLAQNVFATSTEVSSKIPDIVGDLSLGSRPPGCVYYPSDGGGVIIICHPL